MDPNNNPLDYWICRHSIPQGAGSKKYPPSTKSTLYCHETEMDIEEIFPRYSIPCNVHFNLCSIEQFPDLSAFEVEDYHIWMPFMHTTDLFVEYVHYCNIDSLSNKRDSILILKKWNSCQFTLCELENGQITSSIIYEFE